MFIHRLFRFSQLVSVRGATFQAGTRYQLPLQALDTAPELLRKDIPVDQLWSQRPFDGEIVLPIFKLTDGQYTGQSVKLEGDIWNQQLRRDLLHRMVLFTQNLYRGITSATITMTEVNASGAKMRPQKGSGRARQGQRQKPGWYKGVKAHGRKSRSLRLEMPKKVRLLGLKVALSASLYDRKIRIIDSEALESGRTKDLLASMRRFVENDRVLIITGYKVDSNFERAASNLQNVKLIQPDRVNVLHLLSAEWILITKEGLEQLTQFMIDRTVNLYTTDKVPQVNKEVKAQILGQVPKKEEEVNYDPSKPLDLKFKVLREYVDEFEKLKEKGQLGQYVDKMAKTRRVKGVINSVDK